MGKQLHRVLLLAGPGEETRIVYHALKRRFFVPLVVMEEPPSRRKLVQGRLRRLGLPRVLGQLGFQLLIVPALRREGSARIEEILNAQGLCRDRIAPEEIQMVDSVNSEEARRILKVAAPDLVVINGTRILSGETLECLDVPFVNTHVGITPHYRGVHGGYWALRNRDIRRFGVTIHLVDKGIDTGTVLAHGTCTPGEHDNFATYPFLQLAAGIPLLCDSVQALLEGRAKPQRFPSAGTPLWSHPTAADYLAARLIDGVR